MNSSSTTYRSTLLPFTFSHYGARTRARIELNLNAAARRVFDGLFGIVGEDVGQQAVTERSHRGGVKMCVCADRWLWVWVWVGARKGREGKRKGVKGMDTKANAEGAAHLR